MSESKRKRIDFSSPDKQPNLVQNTSTIDWDICFICQTKSKDNLQSPAANALTNVTPKESYHRLASSIKTLHSIDELPFQMNIKTLECGRDLGESLHKNKAKYHKYCKKKFDADKIQRRIARHEQRKSLHTEAEENSRGKCCGAKMLKIH